VEELFVVLDGRVNAEVLQNGTHVDHPGLSVCLGRPQQHEERAQVLVVGELRAAVERNVGCV